MPRKQFIADLQKALSGVRPPGIDNIKAGGDDGQFEFEFASSQEGTTVAFHITALIPDVSDYPASHEYIIWGGEDAPSHVCEHLSNIRNTSRKTVFELIDIISASLTALFLPAEDSDGDHIMGESQEDLSDQSEDEDADEVYGDDDSAFDYGDQLQIRLPATAHLPTTTPQDDASRKSDKSFRHRIRSDLSAAKSAGFKVGHLGSLMNGCSSFVSVSIRMSKLGISDEAMQAWKVDPSEYLILLIQYPNGYKTGKQLQAYDSLRLTPNIGMQVFAGKRYKPTLKEAISAFTTARKERTSSTGKQDADDAAEESSIQNTFISKSLSMLLEKNLIPILRFRSQGMDWTGAEAWYNQMQRASSTDDAIMIPARFFGPEDVNDSHPDIMRADHYHQKKQSQHSFPLLAMQFTLRHFVRCTEFCLICHDKLDSELEAIKPYVCERPLCLFQYMSLGFGPSIEHEIISQPYVVDLLISFCYASARSEKLKEFPDGLNLMVPPSKSHQDMQHSASPRPEPYEAGYDGNRNEVMFFETNMPAGGCPVSRGQWIVLRGRGGTLGEGVEEIHCRVRDSGCYPTIQVDEPVVVTFKADGGIAGGTNVADRTTARPATPVSTPKWTPVTLMKYSQDFSSLATTREKCEAICRLLDTLPSVNEMREYLSHNHPTDLRNWVERLPRDAISVLRWIIASNRSCIMQVDNQESGKNNSHREERLHGMDNYMQFRFAMGAPDKESRFVSEVRKTAERLSLQHPTIFAWHGSPLHNWHMIIREGLHFKNTDHGRAYGHGVYHAKDSTTSSGYSGRYMPGTGSWTKSVLRVASALALNEIVNAPEEFVSQNPFYVVPQLDWIQTRYLLVQCSPIEEGVISKSGVKPQKAHSQDPKHTPRGEKSENIIIPASAIKLGRPSEAKTADKRRSTSGVANGAKKRLKDAQGDSIATAIDLDSDDDASSVVTDDEDLELLRPEVEPKVDVDHVVTKGKPKSNAPAKSTTDFVPGTLDFSTLPVMLMPTYATSATTKRLLSELSTLAKVQNSTPLADLGWSIDTEKIENVYQWIVELHSFHTFSINNAPLPLAQDMKAANATSIVLEIRFGPDFPFSPPYIRIISPRFLPFTQGGGGHIVIGGAMCMELLTNTGWSSVMSMESVLMQVRMAIASEPFARLESKGKTAVTGKYSAAEAADGYIRACASHGWKVPPGFKEVAYSAAERFNGPY